ncbi:MAG: hypothetical protein WC224_00830 [Sphaerochaetaceae bacterium]
MRRPIYALLLLLLLIGCTRGSFALEKVSLYPTVVVTHQTSGTSYINEGVALVILGAPFQEDKQYQISLTSPSGDFVWEKMVKPFKAGDLLYVGASDLLLPPAVSLEKGRWHVELFLPDGKKHSEELTFSPSLESAMTKASLWPPLEWEKVEEQWRVKGYEGLWHYSLYSAGNRLLFSKETSKAFSVNPEVKAESAYIVALHFDEATGVYTIVRTYFVI